MRYSSEALGGKPNFWIKYWNRQKISSFFISHFCAGVNIAKMPPKKPAASKQRQQSRLEKDEQIHFKLHVPPKISEQLSNTFWRPL